MNVKPKITLVTLGVSDLDRSAVFYGEGLGFPRLPGGEGIVFFSLEGTWLALYPREALAEDVQVPSAGEGFSGVTLAHNVASKEEADIVMAQALAAGARLVKPLQDVFWGGYSGYFADPDGHLWEIAWNPFFSPGGESLADGKE